MLRLGAVHGNLPILLLFFNLLFSIAPLNGLAQDQQHPDVVFYQKKQGAPASRLAGTILSYNADLLEIQLERTTRRIPADEILEIRTPMLEEHQQGLRLSREHEFEAAIEILRRALDAENRDWVRQRIYSLISQNLRELGQWADSAEYFVRMLEQYQISLEDCRYLHRMPIAWSVLEPDPTRDQVAAQWLAEENTGETRELKRVLAASWLLGGQERSQALRELNALQQSDSKVIAQIAKLQLWRPRIQAATDSELTAWDEQSSTLPPFMQAGSNYLTAVALANQGARQQAATRFLKVALLNPEQVNLAAESTFRAYELLVSSDPQAAEILKQEIVGKYSRTKYALLIKSGQ